MASADRRRLFMVSFISPCPPAAGNQQHLHRMLSWLKEQGYEVYFFLYPLTEVIEEDLRRLVTELHVYPHDPNWWRAPRARVMGRANLIVQDLERRHITPPSLLLRGRREHLEDYYCPRGFVEEVAVWARQYRPFAVIAQYAFSTRCFEAFDPGVLRIVDTHDLFSSRTQKVRSFGIEDHTAITAEEERALLNRADVIMTSQDDEAQAMRDMGLRQRIFTIAIDMDVQPRPDPAVEVPGQVLIVASDNQPNLAGVRGFLDNAWPLIRARVPQARLHIAGQVGRHFPDPPEGVVIHGFVPDLKEVYRQAQVVVNPVYAGSGLKIKSLEAMAHGKPLVAWANGIDGMGAQREIPCLLAGHWPGLAEQVCALLADPRARRDLSERGQAFIRRRYTRDAIYAPLKEILERGAPR